MSDYGSILLLVKLAHFLSNFLLFYLDLIAIFWQFKVMAITHIERDPKMEKDFQFAMILKYATRRIMHQVEKCLEENEITGDITISEISKLVDRYSRSEFELINVSDKDFTKIVKSLKQLYKSIYL